MPADCDPPRPTGIPATDDEHEISISKCTKIKQWLIEDQGWPDKAFVLVDSGNGGYLLVRIELENTKENSDLVFKCLQTLDFLYTNETFHVDTTSGNPARILRVPGTLNAKGDEVEDFAMHHRMARILEAPDTVDYCKQHNLAVHHTKPFKGGTAAILERCVFNPDHQLSACINRMAHRCQDI